MPSLLLFISFVHCTTKQNRAYDCQMDIEKSAFESSLSSSFNLHKRPQATLVNTSIHNICYK